MTTSFGDYINHKLNSNDRPLHKFLYPNQNYYGRGEPIIPHKFWGNKSWGSMDKNDRWANSWGEVLMLAKQSLDSAL